MRTQILVCLVILAAGFGSCKHEPVYPVNPAQNDTTGNPVDPSNPDAGCDPSVVYFQNDVLPIFVSNCAMSGCHNSGSAQDGVVLENYTSIMNSNVVEPYDAGNSDLIEAVTESDPDKHMPPPPNTSLTPDQINKITNWINQGAKNTVCNAGSCDTSSVTFSGSIKSIIQNKCQGCHSGSAPSGGYDFTTYAGVSAAKTKLYGAVNHMSGFKPMPQGGNKLPFCEIRKIKIWVDAGAPNN